MKVMGNLTLMIWMTVSVNPVLFSQEWPSRPFWGPTFTFYLHVNKEQYAMELKGCVSHFEGLHTHVDSVIQFHDSATQF